MRENDEPRPSEGRGELTSQQKPSPWGFWPTVGFSCIIAIVYILIQVIVLAIFALAAIARTQDLDIEQFTNSLQSNGFFLSVTIYATSPFTIGLIILFAKIRRPPRLLVEDKSGGAAGNRTKTFNAALDELDVSYDEKLIAELINVYRNHIPKITLPQDSRDVLSQLSDKYTLALLTDGFLPAQKLKVQALGIGKYFKCIVYTEELGRDYWKPSPAGFEKLLQTLNVKPETIACIADNEEKDFIAPNRLGFLTIQIIRSARIHTSTSRQTGAAAQYVIQKISELPALLEKLGTE